MRKLIFIAIAVILCLSLSVSAFAASGYATGTTPVISYTPTTASVTKEADKAISSAVKSGEETATVSLKNATTVTADALKKVADAAAKANVDVLVHADQIVGNKVVSRFYIDPAKAANLTGSINLTVKVDARDTKAVADAFKKYYSNEIAVISLGQKGAYGMDMRLAVKVDLSKLNADKLVFNVYDSAANTYAPIAAPAYYIDANGYLHFSTPVGGNIIITDQAPALK